MIACLLIGLAIEATSCALAISREASVLVVVAISIGASLAFFFLKKLALCLKRSLPHAGITISVVSLVSGFCWEFFL